MLGGAQDLRLHILCAIVADIFDLSAMQADKVMMIDGVGDFIVCVVVAKVDLFNDIFFFE
jgi:hypothetical protein